ncbi:MAG: hypothetical protein RB292_00120 [Patescibacteria group bacterium]|jgi:Tfp pilus assembly protein PilO|nr:hypothetical protein [Patescibacteria group bacterium]
MPKNKLLAKDGKTQTNWQLKLAFVRYYKLIILILVGAILGLGYYFVLEPKYQEVGVGGSYNVVTLKTELEKRREYLGKLKELNDNFSRISPSDISRIEQILPSDKDVGGLFVQFQNIALENNLLLAGISVNEVPPASTDAKNSNLKELNISVDLVNLGAAGDYRGFKEFLKSIENNLRIFDTNAVYFDPESPNYSVNIVTYYYLNS